MKRLYVLLSAAAAFMIFPTCAGSARAGTVPQQHIKSHLRVDGTSDLRGKVRLRSGLVATNGISSDTITTTGPVRVGGILVVAGAATTNGLNAGQGGITTAGALQGGGLSINGGATITAGLTVGKQLTADSAEIKGGLRAGEITASGTLQAASVSAGSINGSTGTFSQLSVNSGGTVNFNDAQLSGLSSLYLNSMGSAPPLQLVTSSAAGAPALVMTQAGKNAALSVSSAGLLTIDASGLATPSLTVARDVAIGGSLTLTRLQSSASLIRTVQEIGVYSGGNYHVYTPGGTPFLVPATSGIWVESSGQSVWTPS